MLFLNYSSADKTLQSFSSASLFVNTEIVLYTENKAKKKGEQKTNNTKNRVVFQETGVATYPAMYMPTLGANGEHPNRRILALRPNKTKDIWLCLHEVYTFSEVCY